MTDFDVSAAAEKYNELRTALDEHLKAVQAEIKEVARTAISTAASAFFARNPGVHAIRWTQYTPYWQDGDACEFSAHEPDLEITKSSERRFGGHQSLARSRTYHLGEIAKAEAFLRGDAPDPSVRRPRAYSQHDIDRSKGEVAKIDAQIEQLGGTEAYTKIVDDFQVISKFIQGFKDEDLELVFGDHVQVFVTKDGIAVEEYDHD